MVTEKNTGIAVIYEAMLRKKTREQLVQDNIDRTIAHGEQILSVKKRNSAGAIAKAKKYEPRKDKVRTLHANMKAAHGKNPSFKSFINNLEKIFPTEKWIEGSVNEWWKKLNKGEII